METNYNFVRDMVAKKIVIITYIFTHDIITGPFTKAMSSDVFAMDAGSLGLQRLYYL